MRNAVRLAWVLFLAVPCLTGCLGANGHDYVRSVLLDRGTWAVVPCADHDGDGTGDLALCADIDAESGISPFRTWMLSGRTFEPFYCVTTTGRPPLRWMLPASCTLLADGTPGIVFLTSFDQHPETLHVLGGRDGHVIASLREDSVPAEGNTSILSLIPEPPCWLWVSTSEPLDPDWTPRHEQTSDEDRTKLPAFLRGPTVDLDLANRSVSCVHACGDLNEDGVLDWLFLLDASRDIEVRSGRDGSLLRACRVRPEDFATAAAGGYEAGDVDGDHVTDYLVGGHVSVSRERVARRTCELGLVSLVSGASGSVLRTIERESFLTGAGRRCAVIGLPD